MTHPLSHLNMHIKTRHDTFFWVAGAVAKNDVRPFLNYVYSTGTYLVASDGHRMHYAPTDLPEGYYHPETQEAVLNILYRFPQWERLARPYVEGDLVDAKFTTDHPLMDYPAKGREYVGLDGDAYDLRYVKKACFKAPFVIRNITNTSNTTIRIDYDNGFRAVLLPMKLPKKKA